MIISGVKYKILDIWINVHLKFWYLWNAYTKVPDKDLYLQYRFLCFTLLISLKKIEKKKNKIGFIK